MSSIKPLPFTKPHLATPALHHVSAHVPIAHNAALHIAHSGILSDETDDMEIGDFEAMTEAEPVWMKSKGMPVPDDENAKWDWNGTENLKSPPPKSRIPRRPVPAQMRVEKDGLSAWVQEYPVPNERDIAAVSTLIGSGEYRGFRSKGMRKWYLALRSFEFLFSVVLVCLSALIIDTGKGATPPAAISFFVVVAAYTLILAGWSGGAALREAFKIPVYLIVLEGVAVIFTLSGSVVIAIGFPDVRHCLRNVGELFCDFYCK
jgi:hypothetical protein